MRSDATVMFTCDACGKTETTSGSLPPYWNQVQQQQIDWQTGYSQHGYSHRLVTIQELCSTTCLRTWAAAALSVDEAEQKATVPSFSQSEKEKE